MSQLARISWRASLTRPLSTREIRDALQLQDRHAQAFAVAGFVEYHDSCCCGYIAGDVDIVFDQLEELSGDLWYGELQITGYEPLQRREAAGWRSSTQLPSGRLRCFCSPRSVSSTRPATAQHPAGDRTS